MRILFTIIASALLYSSSIFSQIEKPQNDLFNLDVLNFYSSEGTRSRVDIYVEIPLKNMEFKKSKTVKNTFVAKFDLNIDVKDKDGNVIYNNVSKEEVTTKETGQEYLSQNSQILPRVNIRWQSLFMSLVPRNARKRRGISKLKITPLRRSASVM